MIRQMEVVRGSIRVWGIGLEKGVSGGEKGGGKGVHANGHKFTLRWDFFNGDVEPYGWFFPWEELFLCGDCVVLLLMLV